jgi:hypothetical protein
MTLQCDASLYPALSLLSILRGDVLLVFAHIRPVGTRFRVMADRHTNANLLTFSDEHLLCLAPHLPVSQVPRSSSR